MWKPNFFEPGLLHLYHRHVDTFLFVFFFSNVTYIFKKMLQYLLEIYLILNVYVYGCECRWLGRSEVRSPGAGEMTEQLSAYSCRAPI